VGKKVHEREKTFIMAIGQRAFSASVDRFSVLARLLQLLQFEAIAV